VVLLANTSRSQSGPLNPVDCGARRGACPSGLRLPAPLHRRCALSEKTVAQKARVKPGTRIAVINRVPGIVESLGLPDDVAFVRPADAQLVFLFVRTRAELEAQLPVAAGRLGPVSAIWVFFRKGSRDAGLDMSRDTVWAVAEKLDMRPLGLVSINETWSAFRLRAVGMHGGR
jgi:hypothetical protein